MTLKSTMLTIAASALVVGGAVELLHAQTKAPYYIIGEIQAQNEDGYKNPSASGFDRLVPMPTR